MAMMSIAALVDKHSTELIGTDRSPALIHNGLQRGGETKEGTEVARPFETKGNQGGPIFW